MAITHETLRIISEAKQALERITDSHINQLARAWVGVWDDLAPEFETSMIDLMIDAKDGYVPRRAASKHARLAKTLDLAAQRLMELTDGIEPMVAADLSEVTAQGYVSQVTALNSQLPPALNPAGMTPGNASADALDHIVGRSLQQIHKDSRPLPYDVLRLMKRELIRGIAVGDNPRKTAARIVRQTESRFNGGLTRAMLIARNEVLDSHRAAAKVADEQNADLMAGWRWGASLTARTCPSCLANHGTVHPVSEPGPIDHHQGRCARIPMAKSWAELGFPDVDEPADAMPDARDWFDGLTPATQVEIMGKERLALLQDGKVEWSDLTTRTTNGQWRDSMTVTPLKVLRDKAQR